jgi:hypothetical protein
MNLSTAMEHQIHGSSRQPDSIQIILVSTIPRPVPAEPIAARNSIRLFGV